MGKISPGEKFSYMTIYSVYANKMHDLISARKLHSGTCHNVS